MTKPTRTNDGPFLPPWIPPAGDVNDLAKASRTKQTVAAPNMPLPIVYGRDRLYGKIAVVHVDDTAGMLYLAVSFCTVSTAIDKLLVNGTDINDANDGLLVNNGSAELFPSGGASSLLQGRIVGYADNPTACYAVIKIPRDYARSFPSVEAIVRGKSVYDPRIPNTVYSDNPVLAAADIAVGAGWAVNWTSVTAAANFCDELLSGQKRRLIGLTLATPKSPEDWMKVFRVYTGCFIYWEDGKLCFTPDRAENVPADIAATLTADLIVADSISLKRSSPLDAPTVCIVEHTDVSDDDDWWTQRAVVALEGQPSRVSKISLPGIKRYAQAYREAYERLRKLQNDLVVELTVLDEGLEVQIGSIVSVQHPIGLDGFFRVLSLSNDLGRWRLRLSPYRSDLYTSAVPPSPGGYSSWLGYFNSPTQTSAGTTMYYIKPLQGTILRNSQGEILLQAVKLEAGSLPEDLNNGPVKLYDPGGRLVNVANGYGSDSNGYFARINASHFTESLIIYLVDSDNNYVLDSITLADIADGATSNAVYGACEASNGLAWVRAVDGGAWSPATYTTDLVFSFYRGGTQVATRTVRATLDPNTATFTTSPISYTGELTTVSTTAQYARALNVTVKHDDSQVAVTEGVLAVEGGYSGSPGYQSARLVAYKRSADTPTDNPGAVTFTFATSAWTPGNGWTKDIPTGTSPVWAVAATANVISTDATDDIAAGEWSAPVKVYQDGVNGTGLNVATVFIYQRTATGTAPASLPSAATTYTFSTGGLTGLNNGWTSTLPVSNGTNPYLWVSTATAANTTATDTIDADDWATAKLLSVDGYNTATLTAYIRSATTPGTTPGEVVYTFATAAWTPGNGWSKSIPAGTDPVWARTAVAKSTLSSVTIGAGDWSAATKILNDGSPGTPALSGYLTNENVTLWAYANGNVVDYTPAAGTFKVFLGTNDITTGNGVTYALVSNPQGLTQSINATTGEYSVTAGFANNLTTATITYKATYNGNVLTKVLTLSKALGGYEIITGALPSTNLFDGREIYRTDDQKRYVYRTGLGWQYTIPTTDITGQVQNAQIADDAVTFSKLKVQTPGSALNADPGMLDPTAWNCDTVSLQTITDGKVGTGVLRNTGNGAALGRKLIPVDPTKRYRVRCWARTISGSGSVFYMGVALQDSSGTNINGDGWFWYYAASGVTPPSAWTEYIGYFGPGTTKGAVPSNARTMAPVALLGYNLGSAIHEVQDLRIEEVLPATLIADGSITTQKIVASGISANVLTSGLVSADRIEAGSALIARLQVTQLDSIAANLGSITGGQMTIGSSPARSGTSMTGNGFRLETGGTFALGNATTNLSFNGSTLYLNGNIVATGNLQTNSVTSSTVYTASGNFLGRTMAPTTYTWYNMVMTGLNASVYVTDIPLGTGARVIVAVNMAVGAEGDGETLRYRVIRNDGVVLAPSDVRTYVSFAAGHCFAWNFVDTSPASTAHTYTVQLYKNETQAGVYLDVTLVATLMKR